MVFLCVFKNTDQNNICVSIVLKAKTEKGIFDIEIKTENKFSS